MWERREVTQRGSALVRVATAIILVDIFVHKILGSRFAKENNTDFRTLCVLRRPDLTVLRLSQTLDWKLPESYEGKRP